MMDERELKENFQKRIPVLEALGNWVRDVINTELSKKLGAGIALQNFLKVPPISRVKSIDSFLEKALVRKPKTDPINEITDQVGIRYVVLLQSEVDIIGKIIERQSCWTWRKDKDFEEERLRNPYYFSYQSDHYIVFNNAPVTVGPITIPENTPCEIQVRTLLQHAYAEMSHDRFYKPPTDANGSQPNPMYLKMSRALAKGSALIETTDDVFEEIDKGLKEYNDGIDKLLEEAGILYKKLTGVEPNKDTIIGKAIANNYIKELSNIQPDYIREVCDKDIYKSILDRKRENNVFYRDAIVLILYCLIKKYPMDIHKNWPFEQEYLRALYSDVGINPQSCGLD